MNKRKAFGCTTAEESLAALQLPFLLRRKGSVMGPAGLRFWQQHLVFPFCSLLIYIMFDAFRLLIQIVNVMLVFFVLI